MQILADWLGKLNQTPSSLAEQKNALRKPLRTERARLQKSVPSTEWGPQQLEKLQQEVGSLKTERFAVLCYFPIQAELDLSSCAAEDWYFPSTKAGELLRWFRFSDRAFATEFNHGVPQRKFEDCISIESIGKPILMLVPALACDARGIRLGYGKGYYDRLLANTKAPVVTTLLIHSQLLFDELPAEDHDKSVDIVITEQDCFFISERSVLNTLKI